MITISSKWKRMGEAGPVGIYQILKRAVFPFTSTSGDCCLPPSMTKSLQSNNKTNAPISLYFFPVSCQKYSYNLWTFLLLSPVSYLTLTFQDTRSLFPSNLTFNFDINRHLSPYHPPHSYMWSKHSQKILTSCYQKCAPARPPNTPSILCRKIRPHRLWAHLPKWCQTRSQSVITNTG